MSKAMVPADRSRMKNGELLFLFLSLVLLLAPNSIRAQG